MITNTNKTIDFLTLSGSTKPCCVENRIWDTLYTKRNF